MVYLNSKFFKQIIFLLILLLIIVSILIAIIYHQKRVNYTNHIDESGENYVQNYGKSENGAVDEQSFYDINRCMNKYLNTINMKSPQYGGYDENNNYVITVQESEIKQKIYNLLSSNYISEKNITVENVYNYVKTLNEDTVYLPLEFDLLDNSNMKSFLIHGLIQMTDDYKIIDEIFAIVNINIQESTFSIEPINEKYDSISEIEIQEFEKRIVSNKDNKFTMEYINSEDIPVEYMNLYKRLTLGDPERMYEKLDEEYRKAKFGNVEEFKKYVENNRSNIYLTRLERYQVTTYDDYIQYICVDQNDKYYIFKQKEVLQNYTIMLDFYTKDLLDFEEKYNISQEKDKIALNIKKIEKAFHEGDYKYVYSKLDDSFKSTNFPTQAIFEKYIKEKYNIEDKIAFTKYEKINNVHIYDIEVTNGNKIKAQIVMQLKEGTEFIMSFSASE